MDTADRARPSPAAAPVPASVTEPERLSDSPWFWLTMFGAMALVSLLGIQGKFAQRQARLEQRYQDRLLVQQARAKAATTAAVPETPVQPGYEAEPVDPVGPSMAAARAKTSLVSLQVLAGMAVVAGLIGLQGRRRRMLLSAKPT